MEDFSVCRTEVLRDVATACLVPNDLRMKHFGPGPLLARPRADFQTELFSVPQTSPSCSAVEKWTEKPGKKPKP